MSSDCPVIKLIKSTLPSLLTTGNLEHPLADFVYPLTTGITNCDRAYYWNRVTMKIALRLGHIFQKQTDRLLAYWNN